MSKLMQVSIISTEHRCQRTEYCYDERGAEQNGRLTQVKVGPTALIP